MLLLRRFWKFYNTMLGFEWLDRLYRSQPKLIWLINGLSVAAFVSWFWFVRERGRHAPSRGVYHHVTWIDLAGLIGSLVLIWLTINHLQKRIERWRH